MNAETLRRICLVGVRGVGKTTLVRSVVDELPHVDYVVGSAVLRELAGAEFARFDHLPPAVKHHYREAAIDWMEARQRTEGKHILCDGHTSLLDESLGIVGQVFTERDCTFFRELILLDAPVDLVLARRRSDGTKRRSLDPEFVAAEVTGEQNTSRDLAARWKMQLHHLAGDDPQARRLLTEILT